MAKRKERIPARFVEKMRQEAQNFRIGGHSLHDLTRDELTAVALAGWTGHKQALEEGMRVNSALQGLVSLRQQ